MPLPRGEGTSARSRRTPRPRSTSRTAAKPTETRKPEPPAKPPKSEFTITEHNIPGSNLEPSFEMEFNVDKIKGPGTYTGMTGNAARGEVSVILRGGLSKNLRDFTSVSGSLTLDEWSTAPGGRVTGRFTASMADLVRPSQRGSISGRFSVTLGASNPL